MWLREYGQILQITNSKKLTRHFRNDYVAQMDIFCEGVIEYSILLNIYCILCWYVDVNSELAKFLLSI